MNSRKIFAFSFFSLYLVVGIKINIKTINKKGCIKLDLNTVFLLRQFLVCVIQVIKRDFSNKKVIFVIMVVIYTKIL